MSKNGFEFSGLRSLPVEREFLPVEAMKAGSGLTVSINLDLLTLEKMEQLDGAMDDLFNESMGLIAQAETVADDAPAEDLPVVDKAETKAIAVQPMKYSLFAIEKARFKFFVIALAGKPGDTDPFDRLIHSWNVVDAKKKPVPISYESFMQMPPHALKRLYQFCLGEANNPTASEKKESETT